MDKITYASLASLGDEFHRDFDNALTINRSRFGASYPLLIGGKSVKTQQTFADVCPADRRVVLGQFSAGDSSHALAAISAGRKAFAKWRDLGWPARLHFIRRAAQLMTERQFEVAAILTLEVGKNRFEAIAEVSEAIDLLLYYAQQMETNRGYEIPLVTEGKERTKSILKPYGVWAVVSPFNFPFALAAGMAAGALIGGNTVVFKPASDTPWSGVCLAEIMCDAGLPPGVFNLVTGSGRSVGEILLKSNDVDGFIFTGSREVGTKVLQRFSPTFPKPRITEMGGKNAAIVMPSADLDDAAEGIVRSAFGMGGQKCSACSRLYVHRDVYKPLLDRLTEKTSALKIGAPQRCETFLGPLINAHAMKTYESAVNLCRREGKILYGGNQLRDGEFKLGYFVEPTLVTKLPANSTAFQKEFFTPILAIAKVRSLDEAIRLSNDVEYGLTAGIFTNEDNEREQFFKEIEAGVVYCNRRGGATTGAWPGVQSFGGWKASGSSGKSALGPHYVAQFMREQSQTVINSA